MGWLASLVGGKETAEIVSSTGKALDSLFTSKDEKLTHAEIQARIAQNPDRWQYELNLAQASHRSVFVAGSRPAVVWICAAGLANAFLINPWIQWISGSPGPELPTDIMMNLVVAILGLGALRSAEKISGVAK